MLQPTFKHLALWAALALAAPAAQAVTTYHYSAPVNYWADAGGRNFALYAGLNGTPLSLSFDVAAPLASLGAPSVVADVTPQILAWHFSAGSPLLQLHGGQPGATLSVGLRTDAAGQVLQAQFSVAGPVTIPTLEAYTSWLTSAHGGGYDQALLTSDYLRVFGYNLYGQPYLGGLAENIMTPQFGGTWSVATTVPEPATPALLLLGGAGLLGAARRRPQCRGGAVSAGRLQLPWVHTSNASSTRAQPRRTARR